MRYTNRVLIAFGAAALTACSGAGTSRGASLAGDSTVSTAPGSAATESATVARDTAAVRRATAGFHALEAAVAAGYPRSVANCLSQPTLGGMGYHHMDRTLLDDRLEVERPEILLYSRTRDGEYVFNGVEYIVPYSARSRDATPPTVMGQALKRSDALELWYLHAWVWTPNPAGLFADWNPRVVCRS